MKTKNGCYFQMSVRLSEIRKPKGLKKAYAEKGIKKEETTINTTTIITTITITTIAAITTQLLLLYYYYSTRNKDLKDVDKTQLMRFLAGCELGLNLIFELIE